MAIPEHWSKQREFLRWNGATGYEVVQEWRGPAGAARATYVAWLANFAGYTSLEVDWPMPDEDSDGTTTARIGFASDEEGTQIPIGATDYGLIERQWELDWEQEEVPLAAGYNGTLLAAYWAGWPEAIVRQAGEYRTALDAWLQQDTVTEAGKPDLATYKAEINLALAGATLNGKADWMFEELVKDENAVDLTHRPVLRKTERVYSWTSLVASHTNREKLYSYAGLVAYETTITAATLLATAGLSSDFPYWLKMPARVSTASQGQYVIAQEYLGFAAADVNRWPAAT